MLCTPRPQLHNAMTTTNTLSVTHFNGCIDISASSFLTFQSFFGHFDMPKTSLKIPSSGLSYFCTLHKKDNSEFF